MYKDNTYSIQFKHFNVNKISDIDTHDSHAHTTFTGNDKIDNCERSLTDLNQSKISIYQLLTSVFD